MEKEYKSKFDRFKIEVNDTIKTQHPFGVFSKFNVKTKQEEVKTIQGPSKINSISSKNDFSHSKKLEVLKWDLIYIIFTFYFLLIRD